MNDNQIFELANSIAHQPSVLLLGQNYLNYTDDSDVYRAIDVKNEYIKNKKALQFSQLFKDSESSNSVDALFSKISELSKNYTRTLWLKSILNMRWNLIYTSAIDGIVHENCSADAIQSPEEVFKKEYAQKNPLHMVELFGNIERDASAPKSSKDVRITKLDRLSYIGKIIGDYYGILVIDGWREGDWLKIDKFIEILIRRECIGTYIFGITEEEILKAVPEDYEEDVKSCIESGFIIVEERSFWDSLNRAGYFSEDDEEDDDLLNSYHISFPTGKGGKPIVLKLRKSDFVGLDRNITLIHDDLTGWASLSENELKNEFVNFLTQDRTPKWSLYKYIDEFAFKRDIDDELLKKVRQQLNESPYKRRPILLKGVSNSGKTVSLIRLALRINKELRKNRAVVFYISDNPTSENWKEDQLKPLIKDTILHKRIGDYESVNRVVLICDNIDEDITELQNFFTEDNVVVVGSSYMHTSIVRDADCIDMEPLSDREKEDLTNILRRFVGEDCSKIVNRKNENSIFEVLSRFARFKHDKMWMSVKDHIGSKLKKEGDYTENDTGLEFFSATEEYMLKHGIGASVEDALDQEDDKEKKKRYIENVHQLNFLLATAGQFGRALPFDLVLRIIKSEIKEESFFLSSRFFEELLSYDSMAECRADPETGKIFITFRTPAEATKYLELNTKDKNDRHNTEVDNLLKIIKYCQWTADYSEENIKAVELIRCFGPNTLGRPFEGGDINTKEYKDYWFKIADELTPKAICNGEALLVYCHFLREAIQQCKDNYQKLFDAYDKLTKYYDDKKESALVGHLQKSRVCGEICSNLNAIMQRYDEIIKRKSQASENTFLDRFRELGKNFDKVFDEFVYHYNEMMRNANKSKAAFYPENSYLDRWLNAVENYYNHYNHEDLLPAEAERYKSIMLDSLDKIGRLLDCNTRNDISKLLGNVAKVFSYFKKGEISYKNAVELDRIQNDSSIYLGAMKPFFENYEDPYSGGISADDALTVNRIMTKNKIEVYLMESGDKFVGDDTLEKYKNEALPAAKETVKYFEKGDNAVYKKAVKFKSTRCLYIYLKCKWLVLTNNLLLQVEQRPGITREDWDKIYEICDNYLKCFDDKTGERKQPAVLLLYAFYNWRFKSGIDYQTEIKNMLEESSRILGPDAAFRRLGVCSCENVPKDGGDGKLLEFKVRIESDSAGKWVANINNQYYDCSNSELASSRTAIYISDETLQKICKGKPQRMLENKTPPVNIWFNGKNPQIAICDIKENKGGEE